MAGRHVVGIQNVLDADRHPVDGELNRFQRAEVVVAVSRTDKELPVGERVEGEHAAFTVVELDRLPAEGVAPES